MRLLTLLLILISPSLTYAAGGADIVKVQAINFVIFAAILGFIMYKKVPPALAAKKAKYLEEMSKATRAREAAEKENKELQERLNTLKATANESVENAKKDAEALKEKNLADANEVAQRIKSEAVQTVKFEADRARLALREELIDQAVEKAGDILKSKMEDADQRRLQSEFVDKIQVVN